MARESVTTEQVTRAGLVPVTGVPTVDGDVIDCGRTVLYVTNTGAGSVDVTVISTPTLDGLAVEDLVVSVAAGDTALIGPFPQRTFGQPAGANESGNNDQGRAYVDYTVPADIQRAVVLL